MSGLHARTPETDRLCLAWAETHDPGDGNGPLGKPEAWDEVTKDVVLDAFAAGRLSEGSNLLRSMAALGRGVALLVEAAQTFRSYEAHHRAKARGNVHADDRNRKAERNAEIAGRIEAFLLTDATPRPPEETLQEALRTALGWWEAWGTCGPEGMTDSERAEFDQLHALAFPDQEAKPGQLSPAAMALQEAFVSGALDDGIGDFTEADEVVDAMRQSFEGTADVFAAEHGKCRVCGCGEITPCNLAGEGKPWVSCGWADPAHTLCDNPKCVAAATVQLEAAEATGVKDMTLGSELYEITRAGDVIGFGERVADQGGPYLTLVINGSEFRTQSTSVRGKLGGCPIRAEWDGTTDLRVHLDTPGYNPPRDPLPIVYGSGSIAGRNDGQVMACADPSHDCSELPRPCVIVEATVNELFPGDDGYLRAEAAKTSTD